MRRSEEEAKSREGVFRQSPGSSRREDGKDQVERLKIEAGAVNQWAATVEGVDLAGHANY